MCQTHACGVVDLLAVVDFFALRPVGCDASLTHCAAVDWIDAVVEGLVLDWALFESEEVSLAAGTAVPGARRHVAVPIKAAKDFQYHDNDHHYYGANPYEF